MQASDGTNLLGVDVSHFQGNIDWQKVANAGVKFAYIKATEGLGYTDPLLRRNGMGANAVGILVGYYHFAHPENNTPEKEAAAFAEAVKVMPTNLPHVLDLEGSKAASLSTADLTAWAVKWLKEVQRITGKRVMLYTGAYFARDEFGDAAGKFPLWIAQYGLSGTTPTENGTWKEWAAYQYDDKGTIDGIQGDVDLDYMEAGFMEDVTGKNTESFKDVPADHWAAKSIMAVKNAGVMTGYEDGTFKPDQSITRAEVAAIVNNLLYMIDQK